MQGSRCDACGAPFEARPRLVLDESAPRNRPRARTNTLPDTDPSGLERAFEAFRTRDYARFVELVLMSEPASLARAVPAPEGQGWIAAVRGALVFVSLVGEELTLEAPVARLPQRSRLPSLRLALELCALEAASARVGLRGELLLLRLEVRVASTTPMLLRFHLREIGHLAVRFGGLLIASCDALPAIPEDPRTAIGFDLLGKARKLKLGEEAERDAPRDSIPAILAPLFSAPRHDGEPGRGSPNPPEGRGAGREQSAPKSSATVPAVPVAMGASSLGPSTSMSGLFASAFAAQASAPDRAAVPAPHPFAAGGPPPGFDDPRRKPTLPALETIRGRARSIIELEGIAPRAVTSQPTFDASVASNRAAISLGETPKTPSDSVLAPPDRLCTILLQARSLAAPVLEARPATVTWIVRAAVFRVIYDFREVLPDAASHLYRAALGGTVSPASSRSAELAAIEPALTVFDQVIAARAQTPKGDPLDVPPLTSAALAKEHVARYLAEIDRAPQEASLRHYLALGALTELLARTKLPPQTDQRLRDIVAHAQREGPKPTSIDLLMTALQRISA